MSPVTLGLVGQMVLAALAVLASLAISGARTRSVLFQPSALGGLFVLVAGAVGAVSALYGIGYAAWRGTLTGWRSPAAWYAGSRSSIHPSSTGRPLPVALQQTIVPDFPLTDKSFNQSYAGNDLTVPGRAWSERH